MAKPEDKRIQFLKQDGTDLFTEGDISGATGLYVTAMQLETDRELQCLTTYNEETKSQHPKNNGSIKDSSSERSQIGNTGINGVLDAVLKDAEEAIKVNPTLPKAYLSKATALLLQNKWDEAKDVYTKGINACGSNCDDLRKALQKLYKTQTLLKSIPRVIESSVSSDMSESTVSDGRLSPSCKSRRFRIQHRKKLSRPQSDPVIATNPELFKSKDGHETKDGLMRESLSIITTTVTETE